MAIAPQPVNPQIDPEAALAEGETIVIPADQINRVAQPPISSQYAGLQTFDDGSTIQTFDDGSTLSTDSTSSAFKASQATDTSFSSPGTAEIKSGVQNARNQQARSTQLGQVASSGDWRVKLSLAKGANYLYNAPQPGILQPLKVTNGIVFPYTPKIDLSYKANYSPYELTHSNFKGYFYQNSSVGDITIGAHFTAQSTADANYLLAVIHFFRSATKMFYGQTAQRGSPPPLVFLSGLGQYQFNNHPCLISEFTYSLPDDVDYVRAQVANQVNLNLTSVNNDKQSVATNNIFASISRLANAFTTKGALPARPFGAASVPNLASGNPTYVPTKMDITVRLLPVNTRQQVSQQFSNDLFANGDQQRGGFW
jgi:hypothetical protein